MPSVDVTGICEICASYEMFVKIISTGLFKMNEIFIICDI